MEYESNGMDLKKITAPDGGVAPGGFIEDRPQVELDQPRDPLGLGIGEAEPAQCLHRHLGPLEVVAVEGAVAAGRHRLAHIVKEGGQPLGQAWRRGGDRLQRVLVDVGVVVAALLDAPAGGQLGQDHLQQPRRLHQLEGQRRALGDQHLAELVRGALDREHRRPQAITQPAHGGQQVGGQLEAELGGEPDRAQHAQGVVVKGLVRLARGPEDAGLEVGPPPAERVVDLAVEVHQQRVDGEVAAFQVGLQGGGPHLGLAGLGEVALGAGGGELDQAVAPGDLGGAEAREEHGLAGARQFREPLGQLQGIAALDHHVEVGVWPPQQMIAHEPAHRPRAHTLFCRSLLEQREGRI